MKICKIINNDVTFPNYKSIEIVTIKLQPAAWQLWPFLIKT